MKNSPASQAYNSCYNRVLEQMALLQKNLEAHNKKQASDSRNWGWTGDLNSIESQLTELNNRFTNKESKS